MGKSLKYSLGLFKPRDMGFCPLLAFQGQFYELGQIFTYNTEFNYFSGVCCLPFKVIFTPQPLRAVGVLFSPMVSGWAGGRAAGKVCPGCISETVRCRKLILGRDIG